MAQMSLSHTQPAVSPARLSARTHVAQRVMPRAIGSRASRTARQQASSITASADKQEVICVTGATGFVGKALVKKLLAEGAKVRVLTRNALSARLAMPDVAFNPNVEYYVHNTLTGELGWFDAVKGATGVVNLAGAPISTRWNEQVKKQLVSSRLNATQLVVKAINGLPPQERPEVFVSSSAIGYYGTSESREFTENGPAGRDFLANLCQQSAAAEVKGVRLTVLRTGVVLEKGGGALGKILPLYQSYAGGCVGSGRNWFSWIHRDDLVGLITESLRNPKYEGVINGTAPNPVTFGDFCKEVAAATERPNALPVPGFVVRILLGEGATVVLDGQKVLPKRALDLGFRFSYPRVELALQAIVRPRPVMLLPPPPMPTPAAAASRAAVEVVEEEAPAAAEAAAAAEQEEEEAGEFELSMEDMEAVAAQEWREAVERASAARFAAEVRAGEAAAAEAEARFVAKAAEAAKSDGRGAAASSS